MKLSEEDEQKAKRIAQRVKTVEQYHKLEDRINKKIEQVQYAETERIEAKYEHEADIWDHALEIAGKLIVGYWVNGQGEVYKTEEEAKKHLEDEDEDEVYPACLEDVAYNNQI